MLCTLCHALKTGAIVRHEDGSTLPDLKRPHVLFLKYVHDREFYDEDTLVRLAIQNAMPDRERPPLWFQEEYRVHQAREMPR